MIQPRTMLDVADNSGAKKVQCIRVMGGSNKKYATIGDTIIVAVKEAAPEGSVKKGEVARAVVVRTAKEIRRPDGSHIKFDRNAAVLLNPQNNPIGTRIFGPIARELRDRQFIDRKSTRLNSSHVSISYAVFCLKKKNSPDHDFISLITPGS